MIDPHLRPYCTAAYAKRLRRPEDLETLPLLEVLGTAQGWDTWLESMDLEALKSQPRQYMDSHAAAVTMAANGFGVCLMYDEMMQEGIFASQLVAPFMDSIGADNSYYLCYKDDGPLSSATQIFKDWLLSNLTQDREFYQ